MLYSMFGAAGDRQLSQMKTQSILVTGSSGLIGSEAVEHFDRQGHRVHGIDNNMRRVFFGEAGDTNWNLNRLCSITKKFTHHDLDIRDRSGLETLFREQHFDLIVHCAAQPSHDKARDIPILDFEVNALGTVNLLEATRIHCPDAAFILFSTNKVYGDVPNELPLKELESRWEYERPEDYDGINENCRIDRTLHSLFGASKAAADLVAQEYGRYFGMKVGIFRGGCLTGPSHSGVELHGFLSYLVKVAISERDIFRIRLQRKTSPRQYSQPRCGDGYRGIRCQSAVWRGLQPWWRPRKQHFYDRSHTQDRGYDRTDGKMEIHGGKPQRRSYLLHLRPCQV